MNLDPLGRENYVRLLCNGYLILGKPIPQEFWDEWEEILAKDAAAVGDGPSAEDQLLKFAPEPLEVWAVMEGGAKFKLDAPNPSKDGYITLETISPITGIVDHCILQRMDGTLLAHFNINTVTLLAGDHLHVTLDAAQMLKLLTH